MSELLDDKTDAEIEKIYNRATIEDLQNMLFQESSITRRRLLRKVMRTKSSYNSDNPKTQNSYDRVTEDDVTITRKGSTVSFTAKTTKDRNTVKQVDIESEQDKLNMLKKKLDDTVDLTSRRQLRKDIQELEEKCNSMKEKPMNNSKIMDEMDYNDGKQDKNFETRKSLPVFVNDRNNSIKKDENKAPEMETDNGLSKKQRNSLWNESLANQTSVPTVKSNLKQFQNPVQSESNNEKKPSRPVEIHQSSIPPVKSSIKTSLTAARQERKLLDLSTFPVKADWQESVEERKSDREIQKVPSRFPDTDRIAKLNTKLESVEKTTELKSPNQKSLNSSASSHDLSLVSTPNKSIADPPRAPVKTNLSRVASAREIFEKPSNAGVSRKTPNVKALTDDEINDLINISLKANMIKSNPSRGNSTGDNKIESSEIRTRKTSATGFMKAIPQMKKRAQTARSSVQAIKEQIIAFCQENTREYENIQISNYSKCWADGLAFCALIHHFYPNSFDYKTLSSRNPLSNLRLAFETAKKYAGIEPLLDPEDMFVLESPDEKCVYTYVQFMYNALKQHPRNMFKRNENPSN